MNRREFLKIAGASGVAAIGGESLSGVAENESKILSSTPPEGKKWWKGNLHTHTYWSDGDHYPDMAAKWYKDHRYNFLCLSDHNGLSEGIRWVDVAKTAGGQQAVGDYANNFGTWVECRESDPKQVRLKPLNELRHLLDEQGKFILIQAEEISDRDGIHFNAIDLRDVIPPQGGDSPKEVVSKNILAIIDQEKRTGRKILCTINHPNFCWGLTAEDIMTVPQARFMEVFNGHPGVFNEGDVNRVGVERMWDIVLTKRLCELNLGLVYGVATDDAHNYHQRTVKEAHPGRGWVMVRSTRLTPESLFAAMEAGDFYASTGVDLEEIHRDAKRLEIAIKPAEGIKYITQFIGTRKGYDKTGKMVLDANSKEIRTTLSYSDQIGCVLAQVEGTKASYKLAGDEIYVRAKVISSKARENFVDKFESAWVQPIAGVDQ